MSSMLETARENLSAGFSIIPVGQDKKPRIKWRKYQTTPMSTGEVDWYFNKGACLAVICGEVSGNLEVMDFDDPDAFAPYVELLEKEAEGLFDNLVTHQTPSGGYHLLYRSSAPPLGNTVLARDTDKSVRIETRGQGGYAVVPPSDGYKVITGSLAKCPVLTAEDVETLHRVARLFDADVLKDIPVEAPPKPHEEEYKHAPGTKYNEETDMRELLYKYGWQPCGRATGGEAWTRPGKTEGVSGVLLNETGNFYVWSTNAPPLEAGRSYTTFGLLTEYEYGGDYSKTAKDLARKDRKERKKRNEPTPVAVNPLSLARIMGTEYKPLKWAVEGIIPEGLTVLAGKPKLGKSFLMLSLAWAVAMGKKAWNFADTKKASVHYLALEDSERRIKGRVQLMEGYIDHYPDNLHIYTEFPRIGDDFLETLTAIVDKDPDTGLIIIDTLQKVRPLQGKKGSNIYQQEYEDYEKLQRWAINKGVPVICVHHTRKGDPSRNTNPFDEISGSTGIQGVADTLIVCDRPKGTNEGMMYVTGREVNEDQYQMIFHKGTMTWEVLPPESDIDSGPFILSTWFQDHDCISAQDAAKMWDTNQQTARKKLDNLAEEGKLVKERAHGQNKYVYYPKDMFVGVKSDSEI